MAKPNRYLKQYIQQERLKHFEGDFYQEKKVGDKWLVKMFNRPTGKWQVNEYSQESFDRYKGYNTQKAELDYLINKDD